MAAQHIDANVFQSAFAHCAGLGKKHIGENKTLQFFKMSLERVRPYFSYLDSFSVESDLQLAINSDALQDKEMLAFATWMREFINMLQEFLVGLGHLDIREVTRPDQEELERVRFYEYFQQAEELKF